MLRSLSFKETLLPILALVLYSGIDGQRAWGGEKGGSFYVANEGSASISLIDGGMMKVTATLKVYEAPHNLALSPDGRILLAWPIATPTASPSLMQ